MSANAARELYRRFLLELWHSPAEHRSALAAEIIAPDFVMRRGGRPDEHGPEAVVTLIEQSAALFDDMEVRVDQGPVADADLVAARWTFAGSYQGGLPGTSAPVGTRVAFSGMDLVRLSDGKIAEYWVSSDGDHLMAQLGVDGKANS